MPRPKKLASLESSINSIVARAAAEIATVVRSTVASEIQALVGGGVANDIVKRSPGRPKGSGTVKAAAPPAKGKPGRSDRSYSDADIARTLEVIRTKPGLLPSQFRKAANVGEKAWENLIAKLKEQGVIRVTGGGRSTSYVVASSATAAKPKAVSKGKAAKPPAAATPAKAPPASKERGGARRKGWSDADVDRALAFIKGTPGQRSEQIAKALGMNSKKMFKVLARLRETSSVAVKGYGRGGAYSAAK